MTYSDKKRRMWDYYFEDEEEVVPPPDPEPVLPSSIYGNVAPGGVYTWYVESVMRTGMTFYRAADAPSLDVVGGRIWTPSAGPATVTIMLFASVLPGPYGVTDAYNNLDQDPKRAVTVPANIGGWTEALWEPFLMPDPGWRVMIASSYGPGGYYHSPNFRVGDAAIPAANGAKVCLAEYYTDAFPTGATHGYFRVGSGGVGKAPNGQVGYGMDILVKETPQVDS